MSADQRHGDRLVLVGRRAHPYCGLRTSPASGRRPVRRRCRADRAVARRLRTSLPPSTASTSVPAGTEMSSVSGRLVIGTGPKGSLALDGLIPGDPCGRPRDELLHLFEAAVARIAFGAAVLQLQESHHSRYRRDAVGGHQHLGRQRGVFADAAVGRPRRTRAHRTASATGSCSNWPDRGRAGSPRRAPRRQWRGRDPDWRSSEFPRRACLEQSGDGVVKPQRPRADLNSASASMVSRFNRTQPVLG